MPKLTEFFKSREGKKIYLAGCDNMQHMQTVTAIGHKHALVSYWYLKKQNEKFLEGLFGNALDHDTHVICDSGLFTLMFGSGKRDSIGEEEILEYTREYIKFINRWGHSNITFVEIDAQKLCGLPLVYKTRKMLQKTGQDIMYVWHIPDGFKELDKMAKELPYIALSIPEWRITVGPKTTKYIPQLCRRIRKINPNTRIHLLGCTQMSLVNSCDFDTCDSTSWKAPVKFGRSTSTYMGKQRGKHSTQKSKQHSIDLMQRTKLIDFEKLPDRNDNYCERIGFDALYFKLVQENLNKRRSS